MKTAVDIALLCGFIALLVLFGWACFSKPLVEKLCIEEIMYIKVNSAITPMLHRGGMPVECVE